MTAKQALVFRAYGYSPITATGAVTLNACQANILLSASSAIVGAPVTICDSAANFLSLSRLQIDAYKANGYSFSVADTATDIAALTSAQITKLETLGVSATLTTDASLVLTNSQALQLASYKTTCSQFSLMGPNGYIVSVTDAASNLHAISPAQIAALAFLGVTEKAAWKPRSFSAGEETREAREALDRPVRT